jgi:hypothetical protein
VAKLQMIKGGKYTEEPLPSAVKLFSAYSLVDNYRGRDGVRLNWIYMGRKKPVVPFQALIEDHSGIDEGMRPYFEDYVKELFTEEEIRLLKDFVSNRLEINLEPKEVTLPIASLFIPMPFNGISAGEGRGFYHPREVENELSFQVCAYFDFRNCPPSVCMQKEPREHGVTYLREAIKALGLKADLNVEQLSAAVESLYNELGLHVEQGKSMEDRLKERKEHLCR